MFWWQIVKQIMIFQQNKNWSCQKKIYIFVDKLISNSTFKFISKKTESMALYYEKKFSKTLIKKNEIISQKIAVFTDCFDCNAEQRQRFIDK